MDHLEEERIIFGHLLDIYKVHMDVWEHIYTVQWIFLIFFLLSFYDSYHTQTLQQLLHHPLVIHPPQHHQIIMYDLSLLFLLSFSFIFYVMCEDSSPSYICINQGHLVLYNVLVWVISHLGQHLFKVLKLAPLRPSRYWLYCHYLSDSLLSSHYLCSLYLSASDSQFYYKVE